MMFNISNFIVGYGYMIILNNISLEIVAGEVYGILGVNGVGKIIFFKVLCCLGFFFIGEVSWEGVFLLFVGIGYLFVEFYFYFY